MILDWYITSFFSLLFTVIKDTSKTDEIAGTVTSTASATSPPTINTALYQTCHIKVASDYVVLLLTGKEVVSV